MRKIEQDMITAIDTKISWSKDNTRVVYNPNADTADVYLFDNHLLTVFYGIDELVVNRDTLARHPTRTTKNRLNAFGDVSVHTSKGITYLNGEAI